MRMQLSPFTVSLTSYLNVKLHELECEIYIDLCLFYWLAYIGFGIRKEN